MSFFIFLFFVLYLSLCLIRLDWAVLLLIAGLPSYLIRFQILGLPSTLLEGMILISFSVWFFRHTNFKKFLTGKYCLKDFQENRKKRLPYPFGVEIIILLLVSFVAVLIAGASLEAFGAWKAYFFEPILFFILVLNMLGQKDDSEKKGKKPRINVNRIIMALGVSAIAVSLFAIYQKITGAFIFNEFWADEATRRVTSFFPYPNAIGLYLGPIILIFIGFLFYLFRTKNKKTEPQKIKNFWLQIFFISITIVLSLLSIYFAKSEGALFGIMTGLFIFGIFAGKKTRLAFIVVGFLISAGICAHTPSRQLVYEKIILMDHSGQIRRAQWTETWEMLKNENWIAGAGLANYQNAVAPFHIEGIFVKDIYDPDFQRKVLFDKDFHEKAWQPLEIYLYPHNIFLNFWVELGIVGALLFIWLMIKYFYFSFKSYVLETKNNKNEKYLILGVIGAMIVIIVHGLVDVPYFKNDLSVLFWLCIALIAFFRLKYKAENKKFLN